MKLVDEIAAALCEYDENHEGHWYNLSTDDVADVIATAIEDRQQETVEVALREVLGWFIPSGDEHMAALRPRRDFTKAADALPERYVRDQLADRNPGR